MAKYRLELTKGDELRFVSHLDYAELMRRALGRAKLKVAYSTGFNPHMKMSFAAALALGVTSDAEYMDIELTEEISPEMFVQRLHPQLMPGVELKRVKIIAPADPHRKCQPDMGIYEVKMPLTDTADKVGVALDRFNRATEINFERITPKKCQSFDIRKFIDGDVEYSIVDNKLSLLMNIKITPTGSVKPSEVIGVLVERFNLPADERLAYIHRRAVQYQQKSMMDIIG